MQGHVQELPMQAGQIRFTELKIKPVGGPFRAVGQASSTIQA